MTQLRSFFCVSLAHFLVFGQLLVKLLESGRSFHADKHENKAAEISSVQEGVQLFIPVSFFLTFGLTASSLFFSGVIHMLVSLADLTVVGM